MQNLMYARLRLEKSYRRHEKEYIYNTPSRHKAIWSI